MNFQRIIQAAGILKGDQFQGGNYPKALTPVHDTQRGLL